MVLPHSKSDPRQRNAANGGGEPPSTSTSTPMMDEWLKKSNLADLTVNEYLFAKARSRAPFLSFKVYKENHNCTS